MLIRSSTDARGNSVARSERARWMGEEGALKPGDQVLESEEWEEDENMKEEESRLF